MKQSLTGTTDVGQKAPQGDVVLARFERPDGEVRVLWRQFKGIHYLDCRHHFQLPDGQWAPTKKGVTFRADCIAELATAVAKAQRLAAAQSNEG